MGVLSARQSAFGLTGTDEPECLGIHGREVEEPLGITLLKSACGSGFSEAGRPALYRHRDLATHLLILQ